MKSDFSPWAYAALRFGRALMVLAGLGSLLAAMILLTRGNGSFFFASLAGSVVAFVQAAVLSAILYIVDRMEWSVQTLLEMRATPVLGSPPLAGSAQDGPAASR